MYVQLGNPVTSTIREGCLHLCVYVIRGHCLHQQILLVRVLPKCLTKIPNPEVASYQGLLTPAFVACSTNAGEGLVKLSHVQ